MTIQGMSVISKDGYTGIVISEYNHFGKRGFVVEWDSPRFGQAVSRMGFSALLPLFTREDS